MTQRDNSLVLRCSSCGRDRPRGWFQRAGSLRRASFCRDCVRDKQSAHAARRRGAGVKRVSGRLLARLLRKQGHVCPVCRRLIVPHPLNPPHIDHVISIAKGGEHAEDNLQVLHAACNLAKGSK